MPILWIAHTQKDGGERVAKVNGSAHHKTKKSCRWLADGQSPPGRLRSRPTKRLTDGGRSAPRRLVRS